MAIFWTLVITTIVLPFMYSVALCVTGKAGV